MLPLPPWDEIHRRLGFRESHAVTLSEHPRVLLLVEPATQALALLVQGGLTSEEDIRPARGIRLQSQGPDGLAAVWVNEADLLPAGLEFLGSVARRIVVDRQLLPNAVEDELERWRQLVARMHSTDAIAALGVLGELAVMRGALVLGHDQTAWVGLAGGAIDFRFGQREVEVKTASGNLHEHIINGADQLLPSEERRLFLVSLLVSPSEAGSGTSIRDLVGSLEKRGVSRVLLEQKLRDRRGVSLNDPACGIGYVLRTPPLAVEVDPTFPALTTQRIQLLLGAGASRIRDVSYRLRLDGIPGTEDVTIFGLLQKIQLGDGPDSDN